MRLQKWRENKGLTLDSVAGRVGVASMTVSRWERGSRIPRRGEMLRLFLCTDGQVQPNDFYELPELERAA